MADICAKYLRTCSTNYPPSPFPLFTCHVKVAIPDIGMIYIKGYLYPISYPKIAKKDIPLSLFWGDMLRDDILILADFKVLYPILSYILFRTNLSILVYFTKYINKLWINYMNWQCSNKSSDYPASYKNIVLKNDNHFYLHLQDVGNRVTLSTLMSQFSLILLGPGW
jgi:hypothetical protein